MICTEWGRNAIGSPREKGGISSGQQAIYESYPGSFRQFGKRWNYGRRICGHDRDLLVVFEARRADPMTEEADEDNRLSREAICSRGSGSGEWHRKNVTDDMAETAPVSANPDTERQANEDDFVVLEEVWRHSFDRNGGTTPAGRVVDRAIATHRMSDPPRPIAHFVQQHYPFVPGPVDNGRAIDRDDRTPRDTVRDRIQKGGIRPAESIERIQRRCVQTWCC